MFKNKNRKKRGKITLRKIILWLALLFLATVVIGFVTLLVLIKDLPSPEALGSRQIVESTKIYDREGETLLFELFEEEKRTVIPFEEIPQDIKDATIAIEDANFYSHKAIDYKGILRAIFVNVKQGAIRQGGSTITQQLAKNAFLSADRTFSRKAKELVLGSRLKKSLFLLPDCLLTRLIGSAS